VEKKKGNGYEKKKRNGSSRKKRKGPTWLHLRKGEVGPRGFEIQKDKIERLRAEAAEIEKK